MNDPRESESPFGVCDPLSDTDASTRQQTLTLMREAGAAWIRMDFLWANFEARPGEFDFTKYEECVDQVEKAGLKILATLVYCPSWHRQKPIEAPDAALFTRFARTVVRRFKTRIRHWEIWHEPDHPQTWQPQDNLHAYGELLKQVYPAIKEADPSSLMHLGGLSQGLPGSLKTLYKNGRREFFDIVNIHPFIHPLMPDALGGLRYFQESVYRVMQQNGDGAKPLWITSIGAPGMMNPREAPDWWLGKNPTELHQAEWVRRIYTDVLRWPGVARIFWFSFRDIPGHIGTGADFCGLVRNDFSRKPAFEAYRQAAKASPAVVL